MSDTPVIHLALVATPREPRDLMCSAASPWSNQRPGRLHWITRLQAVTCGACLLMAEAALTKDFAYLVEDGGFRMFPEAFPLALAGDLHLRGCSCGAFSDFAAKRCHGCGQFLPKYRAVGQPTPFHNPPAFYKNIAQRFAWELPMARAELARLSRR